MERFFGLAKHGSDTQPAGWTGQITSNSFMKREFGVKIIEDYLLRQDLRLIVDTSGAYIPGHGTPTVILVGKHQRPSDQTIRCVLGAQGEPGRPENPAKGKVWRSIVENLDNPDYDDDWVHVADLGRLRFASHPWNLGGGVTREIITSMKLNGNTLSEKISFIGYTGQTNADSAFIAPRHSLVRKGLRDPLIQQFVPGEAVRDYSISQSDWAIFPYSDGALVDIQTEPALYKWLWPLRTNTWARATFSKRTYREEGRAWWEWHQVSVKREGAPKRLVFASVATHNHFTLNREDRVFNRPAPFIKLPENTSDEEYLALLGLLNSSTACFWLKQNSHNKGNGGIGGGIGDESWEPRYDFTGKTIEDLPLPSSLPLNWALRMDGLAQRVSKTAPSATMESTKPSATALSAARELHESLCAQMRAVQEELDWEIYRLYGLTDEDLAYHGEEDRKSTRLNSSHWE